MRYRKAAPDVYVGGAPTEQDLRELAARGVHTVVDFRDPAERKGAQDGPAAARAAGLSYVNIPVSAKAPSERAVWDLQQALARQSGGYLLHCAKGPRAEAMYMSKAALDHCWGPAQAAEEAARLGFEYGREPRLAGFVGDFAARHGGAGGYP